MAGRRIGRGMGDRARRRQSHRNLFKKTVKQPAQKGPAKERRSLFEHARQINTSIQFRQNVEKVERMFVGGFLRQVIEGCGKPFEERPERRAFGDIWANTMVTVAQAFGSLREKGIKDEVISKENICICCWMDS